MCVCPIRYLHSHLTQIIFSYVTIKTNLPRTTSTMSDFGKYKFCLSVHIHSKVYIEFCIGGKICWYYQRQILLYICTAFSSQKKKIQMLDAFELALDTANDSSCWNRNFRNNRIISEPFHFSCPFLSSLWPLSWSSFFFFFLNDLPHISISSWFTVSCLGRVPDKR